MKFPDKNNTTYLILMRISNNKTLNHYLVEPKKALDIKINNKIVINKI
jgi:hypothetical protein